MLGLLRLELEDMILRLRRRSLLAALLQLLKAGLRVLHLPLRARDITFQCRDNLIFLSGRDLGCLQLRLLELRILPQSFRGLLELPECVLRLTKLLTQTFYYKYRENTWHWENNIFVRKILTVAVIDICGTLWATSLKRH